MSLAIRGKKVSHYNIFIVVSFSILIVLVILYKKEIFSTAQAISKDGFAPLFIGASAFIAFLAAMFI